MSSDDIERVIPDEVYSPTLSPVEAVEQHSIDELMEMPHDKLAEYAHGLEQDVARGQDLNASLARLQLRREADYDKEVSTDPLTGLLNKKTWLDRLDAMVEADAGHFGVIFIDLSRFKHVNDRLGHTKGDEILQKTAETLRQSLRHDDTDKITHDIGRYGGDEFAVLCDLDPREGSKLFIEERLQAIIDRLRERFEAMVEEEGLSELGFDMAVGGSVHQSDETAEDLLKQADKHMYADKYARRKRLSPEKKAQLLAVLPILEEAGVRVPDEVLLED